MGDPYITDLLAVENAIFVADLISKTRDNGLSWRRLEPYLFTTTMQQECLSQIEPTSTWIFYVGKNRANDSNLSYVYYVEVMLNSILDLYTDSRQTSYVEQLYQAIELSQVPQNTWGINQAIDFISNIPTNPTSSLFNTVMCGGAIVGGAAAYSVYNNVQLIVSGVNVGGAAIVTQNFDILAIEAFLHATSKAIRNANGSIVGNVVFRPDSQVFCFAKGAVEGSIFIQATGITLRPLKSYSFVQATGAVIYSGQSQSESTTSLRGTASAVLTLTGPSTGPLNSSSTPFTVTPETFFDGNVVVTFNDGGNGGTFDPPTLTFTNPTPQSSSYTTASGQLTPITVPISITSTPPSFYVGSPITYSAEITIFLYVPSTGFMGVAVNLLVLPSVPYSGVVGFTDKFVNGNPANGTFTPISLTFTNGLPQTATYTPAIFGTILLRLGAVPSVPLYLDGTTHSALPDTLIVSS